MATELNKKSGQEVAKRNFGKTDMRYWQDAIFKPTYTKNGKTLQVGDWATRMQWRGRRELFNLKTSNAANAAAKAKEIYTMLMGAGWPATLAKFKPEMQRKAVATIGDFLDELQEHWPGRPKTFADYCRSFRLIVSQIFGIKGGREKFDYVNGGRKAWLAKIDRIKLGDVTPEKVNKWRIAFVRDAGNDPVDVKRARISCNSIMRQAKSLFAPKLLAHVTMQKPDKMPFDEVSFHKRESMRYHSTVNFNALVSDALRELPHEQLKIFLLAAMAGLARNEIDKLEWQAFRWNDGVIRIETTKHFTPKSSYRTGDVPIDQELMALFRGWHANATDSFVIEGGEPTSNAKHTHYRANEHFDALLAWLRSKGVTGPKPLHELRKEFGSQICDKHGILVASRMLRHGGISITEQHYIHQKGRVTLGMGDLLPKPDNVVRIATSNGRAAVTTRRTTKRAVNHNR
jgi:integrase